MAFLDVKSYMGDLIYEYVSGITRHSGNKLNFRCPLCGDGKKKSSHRGWFYLDSGMYKCWNAGCIAEGGMNGISFLSLVSGKSKNDIKSELIERASSFSKPSIIQKSNEFSTSSLINDNLSNKKNIKKYIIDKLDLNEWTEKLPKFAEKYLLDRKIEKAPFLPKNYKFYYDKKNKRLVIPWSNEYYQERKLYSFQKDENKYMFPPNVTKPIFGEEMIDTSFKYIFLVEGVFDSIWVKNGLAVGSLTLSEHQKEILEKYKDYTIVYLMDNQYADNSSMLKSKQISDKDPFVNIFIWPKVLHKFKDINETIMFNDKFIEIWQNKEFLVKNICSGLKIKLKLIE